VPDHGSPTVRRRRLAAELRRLRERAGFTGDEVAERLGWSVAAEATESSPEEVSATPLLVGCGGWSKRKTLYGGDRWKEQQPEREDSLLDPTKDAAKIRAFFVHPAWARRGIGGMILEACEAAAEAAGFRRLEMGATLTGVPFYRAKGYIELEPADVPLGDGFTLPIVRMGKSISASGSF